MDAQEAGLTTQGGLVTQVEPASLAARLGVQPGDVLLAVNGVEVDDVIDVQYYAAEYQVELTLWRDGEQITLAGERSEGEPLGLDFAHPTFDTDIRRCNNLCEFCFVLQMAPNMRHTLYVKDDDYRYSFLYGHFVTLTNLSDHDWWRIANQHLSPLYVSVHASDPALRRRLLRNDDAPDIMEQLRWLAENGIEMHTQIVVVPGLNDGPHLERSVRDLATLYPAVRSVSVVPVGLTKHHKYGQRVHTRQEAREVLDRCHVWQTEFMGQLGVRFVYPTDEWYLVTEQPIPPAFVYDGLDLYENGLGMVRRFMDEWQAARPEVEGHALLWDLSQMPVGSFTLVTGALFAPTLTDHAGEFQAATGVPTEVVSIVNTRLGETITVAGLLMGGDVIEQLGGRTAGRLGEVVVLPRLMFDHPDGISLDDITPLDAARALGRPVALAEFMGNVVDVLHGQPALYFDPQREDAAPPPGTIARGGTGGSLEKSL
jgi:putative radical SAM enzyme (TIGR03279 family)